MDRTSADHPFYRQCKARNRDSSSPEVKYNTKCIPVDVSTRRVSVHTKECIPIRCVPTATRCQNPGVLCPEGQGVSVWRGCLSRGSMSRGESLSRRVPVQVGLCLEGGLCPGVEGGWLEIPLPVVRMTHASENITFPCGQLQYCTRTFETAEVGIFILLK